MRMSRLASFGTALTALGLACSSESRAPFEDTPAANVTGIDAGNGSGAFGGASPDGAPDSCRKMDIVFVVDNSFTMEEEQQNLRDNFPRFVQVLDAFKTKTGEAIDYRLAVTTTDSDRDRGAFRTNGGTGRTWLERTDVDVAGTFGRRALSLIHISEPTRPY